VDPVNCPVEYWSSFKIGSWLVLLRPDSAYTRVPTWDLAVVLKGLVEAPFEPPESAEAKNLSLKVVFSNHYFSEESMRPSGTLYISWMPGACSRRHKGLDLGSQAGLCSSSAI